MRAFGGYVDRIEAALARALSSHSSDKSASEIQAILDGQPSEELRKVAPADVLRSAGAFFTGSILAKRALRRVISSITGKSVIFDPACGSGNLLLACVAHLPVAKTLGRTLKLWGTAIRGLDTQPEFVRAARARLVLAALQRGARAPRTHAKDWRRWLPGVRTGCALSETGVYGGVSLIVINPPFTKTVAPETYALGTGLVNSAAIFMDTCLRRARPGTRLVAILPDVLRSGSRYEKWRRFAESRLSNNHIDVYGQFDRNADVDVFVLDGIVRSPHKGTRAWTWGCPPESDQARVENMFDVSVGSVVPHRDPRRGPWRPMIVARGLAAWSTVRSVDHHRRYEGRVVTPPFVAVRRTSRPGDGYRAVGTIVTGIKPVAVENHLLVAVPKDGALKSCKALLRTLRDSRSSRWLDKRMRCRHLTVSALGRMPMWGDSR